MRTEGQQDSQGEWAGTRRQKDRNSISEGERVNGDIDGAGFPFCALLRIANIFRGDQHLSESRLILLPVSILLSFRRTPGTKNKKCDQSPAHDADAGHSSGDEIRTGYSYT